MFSFSEGKDVCMGKSLGIACTAKDNIVLLKIELIDALNNTMHNSGFRCMSVTGKLVTDFLKQLFCDGEATPLMTCPSIQYGTCYPIRCQCIAKC